MFFMRIISMKKDHESIFRFVIIFSMKKDHGDVAGTGKNM